MITLAGSGTTLVEVRLALRLPEPTAVTGWPIVGVAYPTSGVPLTNRVNVAPSTVIVVGARGELNVFEVVPENWPPVSATFVALRVPVTVKVPLGPPGVGLMMVITSV